MPAGPTARDTCPWLALIAWVERALDARGMSPTDLSRDAGIPSATLSGLLNCRHRPSLRTVRKLAIYFRRPLDDLWAMVEPESAPPVARDEPTGLELIRRALVRLEEERRAPDRAPSPEVSEQLMAIWERAVRRFRERGFTVDEIEDMLIRVEAEIDRERRKRSAANAS